MLWFHCELGLNFHCLCGDWQSLGLMVCCCSFWWTGQTVFEIRTNVTSWTALPTTGEVLLPRYFDRPSSGNSHAQAQMYPKWRAVVGSVHLIDYAQLNRFSSADIEYRHFFCCHVKNEVSSQIRFYFPTNYIKFLIILPLLPYPSWVYFCTDCKRDCFFQNGGQISFFWEFFCSDLREIFADFKA